MTTSIKETIIIEEDVESSCYKPIRERFKVLLDMKNVIQQNMADALSIDKAYVSRIVNGLELPPHHLRLKISSYFRVDSSTIWRVEDLPYINSVLKKQKREDNKNAVDGNETI